MSSGALELGAGSQALSSDSRLHSYSECGTSHEPRILLVWSAAHLRQTRRFLSALIRHRSHALQLRARDAPRSTHQTAGASSSDEGFSDS